MKKNLPIIIVVLLLLAGGWYLTKGKNSNSNMTKNDTADSSPTPKTTLSNLKSLIANGGSQSCFYSANNTEGTIFMSGGKVRADIITKGVEAGGQSINSHLLILDNTTYLWMDGKGTGYKMPYDPNATPPAAGEKSNSQAITLDPNISMDYKCNVWGADSSKFDLPKGINFTTFSLPKDPSGGTSSKCSYCESLTGDSKSECLKALNCN